MENWVGIVIGVLVSIVGFFCVHYIRQIDKKMEQVEEVDKKLIKLDIDVKSLTNETLLIKESIYARFKM